ncbi:MAG TPA: hypothetical protein VM388_02900 [Acidimicrobiales bacterium]|nr:hypothetical protein [Acidimicrobiales bacterium]
MAAPDYVPVSQGDRPREPLDVPGHRGWTATRPGDLIGRQPDGRLFGKQGPDQGYALTLVRQFHGRLILTESEDSHDAEAGCVGVGMARASLFGRAPVIYDLELAFGLWGFLDQAPADLVEFRRPLFAGASHHYWDQREIVDLVPESTLRLTPAAVRQRLGEWRSLLAT